VKATWVEFAAGETIKDVVLEVFPSPSFDGTVELGLYIIEASVVGAQVRAIQRPKEKRESASADFF
jgi:hypothetical protein